MNDKIVVIAINASWNVVNFRAGLVRGLQAAGYRVVAMTPEDSHAEALATLGVEQVPVPIDSRGTSPRRDLILLRAFHRALKNVRPAAFLGFTIKPNIYGSLAAHRLHIPVINNIAGLGETFTGKGVLNHIVRHLYRRALRRSAIVFFQNPEDRALFSDRGIVDLAKTRLLPGSGVDLARFAPPAAAERPDDGVFRFLLVARLLWAKGIAQFVEAARIVRARRPDARFQLLGIFQKGRDAVGRSVVEGWESESIIEFLGAAGDVRPHLAAADCIVLPTFYPEGTPRSLLEAAAMARPLIASNVPGCRDVVEEGLNGFLVPPRDSPALAERMLAMLKLGDEERRAMGAASRIRAESRFDEQLVVAQYLEALDQVTRGT